MKSVNKNHVDFIKEVFEELKDDFYYYVNQNHDLPKDYVVDVVNRKLRYLHKILWNLKHEN